MLPSLRIRFDALEEQRGRLLDHFGSIDAALWVRPPSERAWSLAEIAHHLVLVERDIVRQMHGAVLPQHERRSLREVLGRFAVATMLRNGFRVPRSPRRVVPLPRLPYDLIRADWDDARLELASSLAAIEEPALRRMVYYHAVAGRLDIEEALKFIGDHLDHHLAQVVRTERAIGISGDHILTLP